MYTKRKFDFEVLATMHIYVYNWLIDKKRQIGVWAIQSQVTWKVETLIAGKIVFLFIYLKEEAKTLKIYNFTNILNKTLAHWAFDGVM